MPLLRSRENKLPPRRHIPNHEVYQSARWHRFSKDFLKKNRLCVECLAVGKTTVSQCTDHIIPIQDGGPIWDVANMQPLCLHHHSIKTKRERNKRDRTE